MNKSRTQVVVSIILLFSMQSIFGIWSRSLAKVLRPAAAGLTRSFTASTRNNHHLMFRFGEDGPDQDDVNKIEAVIFDGSATITDDGCDLVGPAMDRAIKDAWGISVTRGNIVRWMGLCKLPHMRKIATTDEAQSLFKSRHNRAITDDDIVGAFKIYQKLQVEMIRNREFDDIPDIAKAIKAYQSKGGLAGFTTGFTREQTNAIADVLKEDHCLVLDAMLCADDIVGKTPEQASRPAADMCLENLELFNGIRMEYGQDPISAHQVLKVGDTAGDMGEGVNAGMFAGGLWGRSIYRGSPADRDVMSKEDLATLGAYSRARLLRAGAFSVTEEPADFMDLVGEADKLLAVEIMPDEYAGEAALASYGIDFGALEKKAERLLKYHLPYGE